MRSRRRGGKALTPRPGVRARARPRVGLACYYRCLTPIAFPLSRRERGSGGEDLNDGDRGDVRVTFRFTTAGESHGRGLVGILEGIPAGLPVSAERVNAELKRRMGGYGRGARMKIESDQIEWLAGVRAGETLGSPIAMLVWNRDWEHWQDVMAPEADAPGAERRRQVTRPRPGHADLTGVLKYDRRDARDILERASARETVARVACGAVCKVLLEEFGVEIGSHVVELGGVRAGPTSPVPSPLNAAADASAVRCL